MLSKELQEEYRKMFNADRGKSAFQMIRTPQRAILEGHPEIVARRLELFLRQNDDCIRRILQALAIAKVPELLGTLNEG